MKVIGDKSWSSVQSVLLTAEAAGMSLSIAPPTAGVTEKELRFETPQGTVTQTSAHCIMRHIARCRPDKHLYGKTVFEGTEVDNCLYFVTRCLNASPVGAEQLTFLNGFLQTRTYFASEYITIADLAVLVALNKQLGQKDQDKYPHLCRWFSTLAQQKFVKKVLPSCQLTPAPAAAAATGDDDDDTPAAPKQKNPLDLLPPTAFINDEWKRVYSNAKDPKKDAMPWFWEKYDPAGWSLWYMKYDKLPEELHQAFGASNQLAGFLQRTDNAFRKYSFANCNVVGKEGDWDIMGVWLFRGTDIPFEMKDHPSYQYHTWRKLDHTNAADRALVEDYWCNDNEVEGRAIGGCKVYK